MKTLKLKLKLIKTKLKLSIFENIKTSKPTPKNSSKLTELEEDKSKRNKTKLKWKKNRTILTLVPTLVPNSRFTRRIFRTAYSGARREIICSRTIVWRSDGFLTCQKIQTADGGFLTVEAVQMHCRLLIFRATQTSAAQSAGTCQQSAGDGTFSPYSLSSLLLSDDRTVQWELIHRELWPYIVDNVLVQCEFV